VVAVVKFLAAAMWEIQKRKWISLNLFSVKVSAHPSVLKAVLASVQFVYIDDKSEVRHADAEQQNDLD